MKIRIIFLIQKLYLFLKSNFDAFYKYILFLLPTCKQTNTRTIKLYIEITYNCFYVVIVVLHYLQHNIYVIQTTKVVKIINNKIVELRMFGTCKVVKRN